MDNNMYKYVIASTSATCLAEIATLPICTLKTNYQNSGSSSIIETFKSILNKNGIKGFYRASGWAISSQILSTSTKYVFYRKIGERVNNKFISGAMSGFMGSLMTHPFDVLKMHYQMNIHFIPELRKEGPKIFYRGYSKTITKAIGGSILFFPLFDKFNDYYKNNKYTNNVPIISGMAAISSSIISTTIMQPVDYMKTRHIMNNNYNHIVSNRSIKPYFKGLSLNLLRVVPHFVITMTSIKLIESYI